MNLFRKTDLTNFSFILELESFCFLVPCFMNSSLANLFRANWTASIALTVSILVFCMIAPGIMPAPALNPVQTEESGMRIYHDLAYTPDARPSQSLDLYLSKAPAKQPLPVVILIHGGGWLGGDKADFAGVAHEFVSRGFAVALINYRLSKENIWPAQILDCKSAVRWLRANANIYNLDSKRFVAGGHSAGAHLAAFLAATNGVKDFDKGANLAPSSDVQAVLWFSGIANLITRASTPGYEIVQNKKSDQSQLIGGPTLENRVVALQASPVNWVSNKTAPFFFEAGTSDKVVPSNQIAEMQDALRKHGIYSEVYWLNGVGHFSPEFFDTRHLDLMHRFLKKVLAL